MKNSIPKWLLLLLFSVREAKSRREKSLFHRLWATVWSQEGYAHGGEPLETIEHHYALFDQASTDLIVWVLGIFPIGTMRIIWESPAGLPVLNDFQVKRRWGGAVAEFTLLTIKKRWRGLKHIPSFILMREGYRRSLARGAGIVMAADERLFHLLTRLMPFVQIGPAKFYEGSLTHPAHLNLDEAEAHMRQQNPELLAFFLS